MRALVIGEALIDIVERDGQVTGEHVGGSPLNVAVGLARLGRGVDFLTHIGDDARGRRIVDYVESSGVQLVSGSMTAERTPTALATLDEADRRSTCSTSSGSCRAPRRWRRRWSRTPGPSQPCWSPAVGPPPRCWTPITRRRRSRSTRMCVRRSSRTATPRAWPHRPAHRALRRGQGQRRGHAVDRPEPLPRADRADLAGVGSVDRRGDDGRARRVRDVRGGRRCASRRCKVDVVDTVGAGDAFMTGLIDALWSLDLLGAERRRDLRRASAPTR